MSRKIRPASVLVAVLALSLSMTFSPTALATSSWIASGEDAIDNDEWVPFFTPRYVTASGSNIYFGKTDGPGLSMKWYRCSNQAVNGPGASGVYWTDPDPQTAKLLDYGFAYGARFCLMVLSNGADDKDEFSGNLYWNVYNNPEI